jgi:hypothetical protein
MRPSEAKSAVAYDPALDEYCLLYPTEWTFKQTKVQPCHITLKFDMDFNTAEQWHNFINHTRANGDRIKKLWLKTAGLQLVTYELNECLNIRYESTVDTITIEMECLYYDQYVKVNPAVRYETFPPLEL